MRGAHGPTVAYGAEDAGAIGYCLAPRLRPRLRAAPAWYCTHARCGLSQPAWLRRPFAPAAAPLSLLPRNRWQAAAATRARRARRNPRARARGGWAHWGGDELMPPPAATRYARSPRGRRRACGKRLVGVRRIGQRSGVPPGSGCWAPRKHPLGESVHGGAEHQRCVCVLCVCTGLASLHDANGASVQAGARLLCRVAILSAAPPPHLSFPRFFLVFLLVFHAVAFPTCCRHNSRTVTPPVLYSLVQRPRALHLCTQNRITHAVM